MLADDCTAPPLPGLLADTRLGPHHLELPRGAELLFTDNETNAPRVFGPGNTSRSRYTKDAFHRYIINGERDAVNPQQAGTKACGWLRVEIDPGKSHVMHMRLTPETDHRPLATEIDHIILERRKEADEFYAAIHPEKATHEERRIQRQAFAGLLWSQAELSLRRRRLARRR